MWGLYNKGEIQKYISWFYRSDTHNADITNNEKASFFYFFKISIVLTINTSHWRL